MKIMLDNGAKMPTRAHTEDAGLDLYCVGDYIIPPHSVAVVSTGVHAEIYAGYVGLLTSKSGLMMKGITCRGTIDSGYTGEIKAILFNHSGNEVTFADGDKVTQLVIVPCLHPPVTIAEKFSRSERGDKGFGSTGSR